MRRRRFLKNCGAGLVSASCSDLLSPGIVAAAPESRLQPNQKKLRLISNHDGGILQLEPPVTIDHFRESVRAYAGTPINTVAWCVGGREVYSHDSKVAEVFGSRHSSFDSEWDWRRYQNVRSLIESGRGPLATMIEVCRQEGLDIFASVRMNSHYAIDLNSPSHSEFRLKQPELLIGHPEGYSRGSKEYGIRMGLNYAMAKVRQHMAATIVELFERFDIDGVEMDFMRHPVFFKLHEAVENSHHMTNMLRGIKRKRDAAIRATGRRVELSARVPPSLANALRVGLDVQTWMKERLIDIVIAGGGFIPFDMPFEKFVEVANGTRCEVFGSLEFLRFGGHRDPEVERAIAMRYWNAGAQGLHLFNYNGQPHDWQQQLYQEIGNPEKLARLDKRYQIDTGRQNPGSWEGHGAAFGVAIPAVQLPVTLEETPAPGGPTLQFLIADPLTSSKAAGALAKTQLRLLFENYTTQHKIEVQLNGQHLPPGRHVEFDLVNYRNQRHRRDGGRFLAGTVEYGMTCPPLRQGMNTLRIRLVKNPRRLSAPLKLALVEAVIRYRTT